MSRRSWVMACGLVLLGAWMLAPGVLAQQSRTGAGIEGRITNGEGDALPGVNVVLRGAGRRVVAGTSTQPDGTYALTGIPAGSYRLIVSAVGFETVTEPVELGAGETLRRPIRLAAARYGLDEVVVSATRSLETVRSVASSVSVLGTETLNEQTTLTSDIGDILAQQVPGLAPTSGTLSNYGQTLRGRDPLVLIDGIPQNTPLRDAARYLRTINPGAIERVEVQRGAGALYGYGGAGGIINFVTRQPASEPLAVQAEVGTRFSDDDLGESLSSRLQAGASGRSGRFSYVASGSYERWGQFFDGEGTLIPQDPQGQGGLAGSDEYNVLGKVGIDVAPDQYLEATVNYYDIKQDIEYATIAGVYGEQRTSAADTSGVPGADPGTENVVVQLRYDHADLFGSALTAQAYYHDYKTRFGFATFYPDGGGQGFVTSEKYGLRLSSETPVDAVAGSSVLWGVDALRDRTAQPLEDGRIFVPYMTQWSAAPFAQVEVPLGERAVLRGGARYEAIRLNVDDFSTLFGGNRVEGGTLIYDAFVFNAGGVVYLAPQLDVFASFNQGFSVSDVGRVLRSTEAASVEQLQPEAQKVNSYELGLRVGTPRLSATAAGFVNTSELGSTYGELPELEIIRSPERIYGVELTADWQPITPVRVGGTFTYLEGKRDTDDDGGYDRYLPGDRIPPIKLTGYVAVSPLDGWTSRVQVLHSGTRDRFDGEPNVDFALGRVASYTTVSLATSVEAGPGTVRAGIDNLFDVLYFPTVAQFYNFDTAYTAGRGRTISLAYSIQL